MEAFASFFRSLNKKSQQQYYPLIPEVLNILPPIKDSQDSEDLSKALVALIDLAESAPKMFKLLFHNLVQFSISVIQDKELSDICRQNALELMATFADYAPSMCKKDSSFTNDMITQCLSLMTDLGEDEDVQDWLDADDVRPTREIEMTKEGDSRILLTSRSLTKRRAIRTTSRVSNAWTGWLTSSAASQFSPQPSTGCRA